jgi:ribosomal protein L31E
VCPSCVWKVDIKHVLVHIKMFEELKSSVEMVECEKSVAFLKVFNSKHLECLKIVINNVLKVYVHKRVYRHGTVLI